MAGNGRLDLVHQNAIHVETIRKAQRYQKLHTEFSINPHRKCKTADLLLLLVKLFKVQCMQNVGICFIEMSIKRKK